MSNQTFSENPSQVAYGVLHFDKNYQFRELLQPPMKIMADETKWKLGNGKYIKYEVRKILQECVFCEIAILDLTYNSTASVVIELSSVVFTRLRDLYLGYNNISSVQVLGRCDWPTLETLWLNSNWITTIRALAKCRFPNLLWLSVENNQIRELAALQKCSFSNLENCEFDWTESQNNMYDIQKLAKIQSLHLKYEGIQFVTPFPQLKLEIMLQQRFSAQQIKMSEAQQSNKSQVQQSNKSKVQQSNVLGVQMNIDSH